MTGKEKHNIFIQEAVEPFLVVKGKIRRWIDETDMGDENSTVRARRKKGRKGKSKGKAKEEAGDGGTPAPDIVESTPEDGPQGSIRPEVEEFVLAIHKVESFETPRGKHFGFSAVGYVLRPSASCSAYDPISCTSLFACAFPSQDVSSSPEIQSFDFKRPVIDFYIVNSVFWVWLTMGGVKRVLNRTRCSA